MNKQSGFQRVNQAERSCYGHKRNFTTLRQDQRDAQNGPMDYDPI